HALADDASDANEKFVNNLDCISESGNQDLCDQFLKQCNSQLPEKILKAYYDCLADLKSDVNKCSYNEQLYYSPEDRRQLNNCIFSQVDGSQLNGNDLQQLGYVSQCTEDLAKQAGCADADSS
ncbi:hypothetical protein AVEN_105093-1, partial [Araneus ventricosus]